MLDNNPHSSVFEATLSDAFAIAHVMLIDDVEVMSLEDYPTCELISLCNDAHLYTTVLPSNKLVFTDGKATFTDSDDVVRKVEVFSLIPMVRFPEE